ncbi:hypothetical protein EJ04DRAFT_228065 [Polyplosphaeria fusca]|uniref:Uncharacterized protein n=1 Tax=Polyplosphaeria fusca TaxID=682080 RepID=A0A9P4V1U7_9PLEO|nr:hypothetical protein EJ04DRAFT_228065 [Polyplosphaeria fusca]
MSGVSKCPPLCPNYLTNLLDMAAPAQNSTSKASSWLAQVNAMEQKKFASDNKKAAAMTKTNTEQAEWNTVLQSVNNRASRTSQSAPNHDPVQKNTIKTSSELDASPFESPFDSPPASTPTTPSHQDAFNPSTLDLIPAPQNIPLPPSPNVAPEKSVRPPSPDPLEYTGVGLVRPVHERFNRPKSASRRKNVRVACKEAVRAAREGLREVEADLARLRYERIRGVRLEKR